MMIKKQLLDNRTGKIIEPKTYVSYKKENNHLTFCFKAYDSSLNSYSTKDNDALYNGDVVEVFLDFGDEYYFEFEVAPSGATFVAKIDNMKPIFIDDSFFDSDVVVKNKDYYVKMVIDLSCFKNIKYIRFNAFRIETQGIKPEYILQALSPTLSNSFHVRDKFMELKIV